MDVKVRQLQEFSFHLKTFVVYETEEKKYVSQ